MLQRKQSSERGFTLVEMAVVVAILAIVAGLALPNLFQQQRQAELRARARELTAALGFARSQAAAGGPVPDTTAVPQATLHAGIRFDSATQYRVFVDNDNTVGQIWPIRVVGLDGGRSMLASDESLTIRVNAVRVGGVTEAPPNGIEFRFRRNGTITLPVDGPATGQAGGALVCLQDTDTGEFRELEISFTGQTRVTPTRACSIP